MLTASIVTGKAKAKQAKAGSHGENRAQLVCWDGSPCGRHQRAPEIAQQGIYRKLYLTDAPTQIICEPHWYLEDRAPCRVANWIRDLGTALG